MRKRALIGSIAAIGLAIGLLVIHPPVSTAQAPQGLEAQHQRLLPLFGLDGVVYTDADERTGRLVVGVTNRGLETSIRARLNALGVSSQSVDVLVTEPIVQVAKLQDWYRPLEGGLQVRFDNYLCTLGFTGMRAGIAGFLMNSHCTTKQGGVNSTKYYQPLDQIQANFIGTEIADPAYRRGITGCPPGKMCRWSDSAYVRQDYFPTAEQGYIARLTGMNDASSQIVDRFRITSKGDFLSDRPVNKVGRTTGWTAGTVTNTCVTTGVSGTNIVQICQNFVSAGVGSGDSGSPVFSIDSINDVRLVGILWGGNTSGTQFVYSPIGNIERNDELGPLSVCAAGFGC